MCNHPTYQKLLAEIDAATSSKKLSNPVKYTEATELPYLSACTKEAMRLWPSIGMTMSRVVPVGGATIAGHYIPSGYKVGINPAVVQHDDTWFGPDAGSFRPERWLEGDARMMDGAMLQFGGGTRTCLGRNVSHVLSFLPDWIEVEC